jgi:hypothetical protein
MAQSHRPVPQIPPLPPVLNAYCAQPRTKPRFPTPRWRCPCESSPASQARWRGRTSRRPGSPGAVARWTKWGRTAARRACRTQRPAPTRRTAPVPRGAPCATISRSAGWRPSRMRRQEREGGSDRALPSNVCLYRRPPWQSRGGRRPPWPTVCGTRWRTSRPGSRTTPARVRREADCGRAWTPNAPASCWKAVRQKMPPGAHSTCSPGGSSPLASRQSARRATAPTVGSARCA